MLGTGKGWEVSSEDCTWKNKEYEGVIHDFPFSYYANSAWSAIILLMNEELNDSSYVWSVMWFILHVHMSVYTD